MHPPKFIVPVRRGPARPLFMVHSVAGELTWLPYLLDALEARRPLYGFAAPGLNAEAPFFGSLEAMAAAYLRGVREVQPQGPYLLGGYSMGGVVAFEMARQLQDAGESTALLALMDSYVPHADVGGLIAAWSRNGLLMQVVANQLALQWGCGSLLDEHALRHAPYSAHSGIAARHLLAHASTRHTLQTLQPYLRRCQTVMRVHAQLLADYRPRPLGQPVAAVLWRASHGLIARDSALRLPRLPDAERAPPHRWDTVLARHDTVDVAQEHFFMGTRGVMEKIAQELNTRVVNASRD